MATESNLPTSGLYVLLSTTIAHRVGLLALPWTNYQVYLWTHNLPGIEFTPDYGKELANLVTDLFTLCIGVGHIIAIVLYRRWSGNRALTRAKKEERADRTSRALAAMAGSSMSAPPSAVPDPEPGHLRGWQQLEPSAPSGAVSDGARMQGKE
jgi:hypothetical protein